MKKKIFYILAIVLYGVLVSLSTFGILSLIKKDDKGKTGGEYYSSFDKYYALFPENESTTIDINIILKSNLISEDAKEILKKDIKKRERLLQNTNHYTFLFVKKDERDCIIALNSYDAPKSLVLEKGFSLSYDAMINTFKTTYNIDSTEDDYIYANISKKDDAYCIYFYVYKDGNMYIVNGE